MTEQLAQALAYNIRQCGTCIEPEQVPAALEALRRSFLDLGKSALADAVERIQLAVEQER